ncbi:MAG: HD domain-containing protein [Brevinematales bacterium]|nr:HD domain-containing protein [Brevinematales bacterium]
MKEFKKEIDLFPSGIPEDIVYIVEQFIKNNYEIYLVGGAVRNLILYGDKNINWDFDFTTNATPEEVIKLFKKNKKVFTVPTGIAHGTVSVVFHKENGNVAYEITTYRTEDIYEDGRHPKKVNFSKSLIEDLSRRDFTINSIAYQPIEKFIVDPFEGIKDLKRKIIKTVGNPVERFSEDGLRPIRACRIAAQLDFEIEKETFEAIPKTLEVTKKVSMERVREEFMKLLKTSEKPSIGIELMRESGILELFMPELLEGFKIEQNEFHKYDIYYHNLYSCDAVTKERPLVRLAALLHDIGKARAKSYAIKNGIGNVFYNHEVIGERITEKIMKRLKFSNADIHYVKKLVRLHMFYYTEEWTDGAVRRFLRKFDGDENFLKDLFELRKGDRLGSGMKDKDAEILEKFRRRINKIVAEDNALKVTDLDINGYEIMERFNIPPSRTIGEMLEYMLEKVLDNPELNKKEKLFEIGKEFLEKEGKL